MIYQVNTVLFKRNFLRQFLRYAHYEHSTSKIIYPLDNRKILRVAGSEASVFLQGLITNDMRHFEDGAKSMYAMFLNNKGRVLFDTLIHKTHNEDAFVLECDMNIISQLIRHLKLFKLKRKVEIVDASNDYSLWAFTVPNTIQESSDPQTNIHIIKDPRLSELGYRILSPASVEINKIIDVVGKNVIVENAEGYKSLRYKLGVSEGSEDLPPGVNFPLEVNCDYLHGVSFHKGCYIGQELTARVHHTGVVRKRIMPIIFNENVENLPANSVISISDKPKSNVGKLKGFVNNYGLGLLRIKEAMEATTLNIEQYAVKVIKPSWWPIEAPKEKAAVNKLTSE